MHQFGTIPVDKPYIQLLHAGSMHWVCISNMETSNITMVLIMFMTVYVNQK